MTIPLSASSKALLATCHPDLQAVVRLAAERTPLVVTCGFRNKKDQRTAFLSKASRLDWPKSRHNTHPSEAVDVVPLPIDWFNLTAFKALAVVMKEAAKELGIAIEHGGDWKSFPDFPHWQLKNATTPSTAA